MNVFELYKSVFDIVIRGRDVPVPYPAELDVWSEQLCNALSAAEQTLSLRGIVDVTRPSLALALIVTTLPPLLCNILGLLQYHTKCITTLTRSRRVGVYLCAVMIATLSMVRSALFAKAIREQPAIPQLDEVWVHALGGTLFAAGAALFVAAYVRLGIRGTYLGDYFGLPLDERVVSFPFNVVDHPMYDGSSLFHLAEALLQQSPAGILLAAWLFVCYRLSCLIEEPYTDAMYASARDRVGAADGKSD